MSSARANCQQFQEKAAKKREKDFMHQQRWEQQVNYYQKFDKKNSKFDSWTSPRYYESQSELVDRLTVKRNKEENLMKRREKLRKLLREDDASYEIEMMIAKAKSMEKERVKLDEIPTELLKDLNIGLKVEEDERKRKESELKLYQQWRRDNPFLREVERDKQLKHVKISWLDQQIEKRMLKEKEKEECKKYLKERDENILKKKEEEERIMEEVKKKNIQLKEDLLKQIDLINDKEKESEALKQIEREHLEKQNELYRLEEKLKQLETYTQNKKTAIYNLRQHKIKLLNLSRQIQENLDQEQEFIKDIISSNATELINDRNKKQEIKSTLDDFLKFSREQKELEQKRKQQLDFIFESELKEVLSRQQEVWDNEERMRKRLLKDVLDTIRKQIDEIVIKNREKQKEIILDRERILQEVEQCEKEMVENKMKQEEKKLMLKEEIENEIKRKKLKERKLKEIEKRNFDVELEKIKCEEDRLKKEIMKIQNSNAPLRYVKKRPWY